MISTEVLTRSEASTRAVARALAGVLQPGSRVLLTGDLGAGKTAFVKGLVSGLGHHNGVNVRSPTYALCHVYPTTPRLWHADLYRLSGGDEVDALGVLDGVEPEDLLVVEWADRVPALLADGVHVHMELVDARTRRMVVKCAGSADSGIITMLEKRFAQQR